MTIDQVLYRLEEEMHCHLDSPVVGDFMSLTRGWREILTDFSVEMERRSLTPAQSRLVLHALETTGYAVSVTNPIVEKLRATSEARSDARSPDVHC